MRAFFALLFVAVASANLAPLLDNSEPIPGKYIIKLKEEYDTNDIVSTVRISGGRVGAVYSVIKGFAAELSDKILEVVRNLPAVEYVEQDGIYRTQAVTWGLDRIDQINLPLDENYEPTETGYGYTVWVIDTGVNDQHNNFDGRARLMANFVGDNQNDCHGHGTHCSGTVGSRTYGVAKSVNIRGVKVLDCQGIGANSIVIAGVDHVSTNADSWSVASMSLGGGISEALDEAVNNLISGGVPTAVAAGNSNLGACNFSPARVPNAITVGATDELDRRASFSNYGSCVDIFAPGTNIVSTWNTNNFATYTMSGTSMSCPHVAGAITLYKKDTVTMLSSTSNDKITHIDSESPNKLLYVN